MFNSPLSELSAELRGFQALSGLILFITDAKACQKRAEELTGLTVAAMEAQAAAEKALADLATRGASLDAREAELENLDRKLRLRGAGLDEQAAGFAKRESDLLNRERQLKWRMMSFARMDHNFNEKLQDFPSFAEIEAELAPQRDQYAEMEASPPPATRSGPPSPRRVRI